MFSWLASVPSVEDGAGLGDGHSWGLERIDHQSQSPRYSRGLPCSRISKLAARQMSRSGSFGPSRSADFLTLSELLRLPVRMLITFGKITIPGHFPGGGFAVSERGTRQTAGGDWMERCVASVGSGILPVPSRLPGDTGGGGGLILNGSYLLVCWWSGRNLSGKISRPATSLQGTLS
jgi:hypothetical protein